LGTGDPTALVRAKEFLHSFGGPPLASCTAHAPEPKIYPYLAAVGGRTRFAVLSCAGATGQGRIEARRSGLAAVAPAARGDEIPRQSADAACWEEVGGGLRPR